MTFDFGKDGWNALPDAADDLRGIADIDGVDVYIAGIGWPGRRRRRGLRWHRHHPALRHPRRRDPDPALHLPQPGAVDPADHVRGHRPVHLPGPHLLPGEVRRPDGQRPVPGHLDDPGHRRRHRLRPAPGGALSRRAPSPRGPARGDGLRPAPGRPGALRQRGDRDHRHALPAVRRDELHRRARPGGRHRHRGDVAGQVTLLPALLVITGRWIFWPRRPAFGSAEPTADRHSGPRSGAGSSPTRAACGSAPA